MSFIPTDESLAHDPFALLELNDELQKRPYLS